MMEGLDLFGEGNQESAEYDEFEGFDVADDGTAAEAAALVSCFLWVLGFGGMCTTQQNRKDQGTYSDRTYL